jgi:putative transcriptional regulator
VSGERTELAERLGNTLKSEREARGWTQADLAARVGVSRKTINTIENGVFVPSTITALKISKALGKAVEELFSVVEG